MSKCAWCARKARHELDGKSYCCQHFDVLVEHSGNIKSAWLPETAICVDRHNRWQQVLKDRLKEWKERHEKEKALRPKCLPNPAPER